ncbi:MAG: cellulose synthase operon protein YhjQ, partial [Burkholderiales bacterium]|nr:cellulose synthase operon protein YhjQ [Burkholderiales bacterium]
MRVVAVISPKGGVGKTTITANLATSLARMGTRITVLDLDPQNALRLHFGMAHDDAEGIAQQDLASGNWRHVMYESAYNVNFIPYGNVDEAQRFVFEQQIKTQPDWLSRHLADLGLEQNSIVLIDTPPGPSIYMQQVLKFANIAIVVLKPDAASYSTIPSIEGLIQYYCSNRKDFLGYCYLLNQMDATKQLSRDVYGMLRENLGGKF